jgi:hypothetical protein
MNKRQRKLKGQSRNTRNSRHTRHSEKKTEGTIKNGQQETLATVDTQDTR